MSEPMNIDQSLDDIIKSGKGGGRPSRGNFRKERGGGSSRGTTLRVGGVTRTIKKAPRNASEPSMEVDRWEHDKFQSGEAKPIRGRTRDGKRDDSTTGSKILITNLDYKVNNRDINDLFQGIGPIKQAMVKYDKAGKSTGTAEVVFTNKNDALEAIKKYNGVPLDNRPLKISLSTTHSVEAPLRSSGSASQNNGYVDLDDPGESMDGPSAEPVPQRERRVIRTSRGGRGRGRGGGRGRGSFGRRGGDRPVPTKEDLDAELDSMVDTSKLNPPSNNQTEGNAGMSDN